MRSPWVAILLGNGTGSFGPATSFGLGPNGFSAVAVGDFNGDKKADIAATNGFFSDVSILLGTGTGSFGDATKFNTGTKTNPYSVVTADFNADGKLDLATANNGSNNVSILLGTGTGSFGDPANFNAGTMPQSVTVGDFNGDNKSDLAVANNESNNVSILLGTGTGSFGDPTNFNVGRKPQSVTVGDFNSDNKSDLALANNESNNVSILLGNGTGSFGEATNFGAGKNPYALAVGDFDTDGKTDLVTPNLYSDGVSVLLNLTANFGAANYSAIEESTDTEVNIPVTLNATPAVDITVPIAINPSSTATQNSDYTFSPTTLTFIAGTSILTQNIAVTVKADNISENAEKVVFNFGMITDGIAGKTNQTTLTIASTAAEPLPDSGLELVNNSPEQKIATDGDDTLSGDNTNDVLSGKKGNDLILGFNGNDWINGNQGNDLINGGFDDDTLYGGKGIDTITGSDGADTIFGNRGDDLLDGSTGNDTLRGGKGNDTIIGGLGDDFLFGEDGDDSLIGGNGRNRFFLSTNSGIDTILDFANSIDLISLANGLTFSQLSITQENSSTFIRLSATGKILASLNGVSARLIDAADFNLA